MPRSNALLVVAAGAAASAVAIAACAYAVPTKTKIGTDGMVMLQITPAGTFGPSDGRPMDSPDWNINAASAQQLITRFQARRNPAVIDYEHQTLNKEKNGQPAPAAGWMRDLRWIDGQGLFAVAELTQRARDFVSAGEYSFFSPVFEYSRKTGAVLDVHMGALTNNPAIHGMEPLSLLAVATAAFLPQSLSLSQPDPQQENSVNPLLTAVLAALALPATTTEAVAIAALTAVGPVASLQAQATAARAALNLGADASGDAVTAACTSLRSTATPDPSKFVPLSVLEEVKTSLAALTAHTLQTEINTIVGAALNDGGLLAGEEGWARNTAATNMAVLTGYLAIGRPRTALNGTQTGGKSPIDTGNAAHHGLNADELAVAVATGLTPEAYAKAKG